MVVQVLTEKELDAVGLHKIQAWLTQIGDKVEYSELLHRRGFQVNMRLYNINPDYKKMIESIIGYMKLCMLGTSIANFNFGGVSGHNVGIPLNIIIVKMSDGIKVMINPKIIFMSEETCSEYTLCGSIMDGSHVISRPRKVTVNFFTEDGENTTQSYLYGVSTIIQHEVDHNNGILVTDRKR